MKLLMKKVGGTTEPELPAECEQTTQELVTKKVRNRPLFHVKVITNLKTNRYLELENKHQ